MKYFKVKKGGKTVYSKRNSDHFHTFISNELYTEAEYNSLVDKFPVSSSWFEVVEIDPENTYFWGARFEK